MSFRLEDLNNERAFIEVRGLCPGRLFLKIEAFNPAGSIKIKAALAMIDALEREKAINHDSCIIESSSGNLGVALAMICAARGYSFICVVDPNISDQNRKTIAALGAKLVMVDQRDENGGYLGTRIRYIQKFTVENRNAIWLNQYANPENARSHENKTARSIAENFENIDFLFIGAGTTGTLMGCKSFFAKHRPTTKVIAVDSIGSVTFGHPPSPRHIPGLGASRRPEIFDNDGLHALERVAEMDAVMMCRWLARTHGYLSGGSTGTVLSSVRTWANRISKTDVVVAVSPDMGERYLNTIYSDEWVKRKFGDYALAGADFLQDTPQRRSDSCHAE